jgi:hypothetical protein
MTTTPTTLDLIVDAASAASTQDLFIDLVCADDQLLAAEFDAMVAECWDGPGPVPVTLLTARATAPSPGHRGTSRDPDALESAVLTAGRRAGRQRSPPVVGIGSQRESMTS